ncbi:MAG: hypothetical protein ACP5IT_12085 [Thermoproteota archaeon]
MSEELLIEGWKKFISLFPEEKIIYVYKNVEAWSKTEKVRHKKFCKDEGFLEVDIPFIPHFGDLVLTNKRLIYFEYYYKVEPLTKKEKLIGRLVNFTGLGSFVSFFGLVYTLFAANIPLAFLFLLSTLLCWGTNGKLVNLQSKLRIAKMPIPTSYTQVMFEVPLEKIASAESISPTSLTIKMTYKIEEITLDFLPLSFYDPFLGKNLLIPYALEPSYIKRRKQEAIEFKRNLSLLVYEVQHRPKEVVSYNIVTEFNLNKDGTISVKCPFCGASAPLHSKESEVVCKYCGKTYVVPKKILELIS